MLVRFFSTSVQLNKLSLMKEKRIKNLFVISLDYVSSIQVVDKYLSDHREFLDRCYHKGLFIASGRKIPRTGGVILALSESKQSLEELLDRDPFKIHGIAKYSIVEFEPTRYHQCMADILESSNPKYKL